MGKPLAIDLFCGLGGWADGFLLEGYDCIGFDIERHDYGSGGYPGQLVLQDVLTLHGSQFRNAAVIVASPPCQAYSYRAMPWGALWREHSQLDDDGAPAGNYRGKDPVFNDLFKACFRIACEAGLPIVIENVKGAQEFLGPAKWHFGSYYLWGDVPALMPFSGNKRMKFAASCSERLWRNRAVPRLNDGESMDPWSGGVKQGGEWWHDPKSMTRKFSSRSRLRKAASAQIAKIPLPLSQHIARVFKP